MNRNGRYRRILTRCAVVIAVLYFSSCSHDNLQVYEQNSENRTIGNYIHNNFDLSLFYAALEKTELVDELNAKDIITVFAPSDKAFNAMGIYNESDIDALNRDSLKNMLLYCMFESALLKSEVPLKSIDTEYTNKAGKNVLLSVGLDNNTLYFNGIKTSYADIVLANGVLNNLDNLPKYREGTVQDFLAHRTEYSCFVAALKKFGYWDRLSEPGPWTVVAPDDQSFKARNISLQSIEAMQPDAYKKRLFGGYIFKTRVFVSDLLVMFGGSGYPRYGSSVNNLIVHIDGDEDMSSGIYLKESSLQPTFFLLNQRTSAVIESPLSSAYQINYMTDNGVIHNIDALLLTPTEALY